MDRAQTISQSTGSSILNPQSICSTDAEPPAHVREIVSLAPPGLTLLDHSRAKKSKLLAWTLFNKSGKYWLTDIKCARSRILRDAPETTEKIRPLSSFRCCSCYFCGCFELCGDENDMDDEGNPIPLEEGTLADRQPVPSRNMSTQSPLDRPLYIVVGLLNLESGAVRERLEEIPDRDGLFKAIRKAAKDLRPLYLRLFSLKTIGGFGLYICEPAGDYHVPVDLDDQSSATLHELFSTYSSHDVDWQARWGDWVHQHLNRASTDPQAGRFALRLVLRWSIFKLVIYSTIPVVLSLAVGLWFMFVASKGLEDSYTAVVQTAWTISSYIVTTAGVLIALLAAVTALGDKA